MAVAESRRDQDLHTVTIGQRECGPLPVLRRAWNVVDDHEVERSMQAGNQLGGFAVAVDASQDVLPRHRNVILDELVLDARGPVGLLVVNLDVMAAEIFEDGRRLDDEDAVERTFPDVQGRVR